MKTSHVARLLLCLLAAAPLAACAGEEEEVTEGDDDVPAEARADGLSAASLASADILRINPPSNWVTPWDQPESEGWFDEKGKCGQTATANLLRLYGREVSPQTLYERGVYSLIGTRGTVIRNYLQSNYPADQCRIEHPTDGPDFLRTQLAQRRPVMVLYKTDWKNSHWVTAVATTKAFFGGQDAVVVQSYGKYYAYRMEAFDAAWRNVYGLRRPSIVCNKASDKISGRPLVKGP